MDNQLDYLRFTEDDGITLIPAWRQTYVNREYAIVWVKVPHNLDMEQYICMYYGTGAGYSYYNRTAVFIDEIDNVELAIPINDGTGSAVNDYSGNDNDGQVNGASWITTTPFGYGLSFDGNDYVYHATATGVPQTGNPITYECYVQIASTQDDMDGLINWAYSDPTGLVLRSTNNFCFRLYDSGGTPRFYNSNVTISHNVYNHLIAVYDGTDLELFLNGAGAGKHTSIYTPRTSAQTTLYTGSRHTATNNVAGQICEVKIYSDALTYQEITNLSDNYGDPKISEGEILVRKFVYPEPYVLMWGTVSEGEPTAQQAYDYAEELFGVAFVFILIFFVVALGVAVSLKK